MNLKIKKHLNKLYNNESGMGLAETLLALGIGIIIITSLVSLALFTVRASLSNNLSIEATQRANQQIELVRAYRDSHTWDEFLLEMTNKNCFTSDCYMSGIAVNSGKLTLNSGSAKELLVDFSLSDASDVGDPVNTVVRVSVDVTYSVGSDAKSAHNYTELSNWRTN